MFPVRVCHTDSSRVEGTGDDGQEQGRARFQWNTISILVYHMAEADPVQEIAFTLANGVEYVQAAVNARMVVDEFAPRLSFFFRGVVRAIESGLNRYRLDTDDFYQPLRVDPAIEDDARARLTALRRQGRWLQRAVSDEAGARRARHRR
ncbi:MAG: methylmalonyl-CoA mutase family protein [Pseudonocardiaceae bacterium]